MVRVLCGWSPCWVRSFLFLPCSIPGLCGIEVDFQNYWSYFPLSFLESLWRGRRRPYPCSQHSIAFRSTNCSAVWSLRCCGSHAKDVRYLFREPDFGAMHGMSSYFLLQSAECLLVTTDFAGRPHCSFGHHFCACRENSMEQQRVPFSCRIGLRHRLQSCADLWIGRLLLALIYLFNSEFVVCWISSKLLYVVLLCWAFSALLSNSANCEYEQRVLFSLLNFILSFFCN